MGPIVAAARFLELMHASRFNFGGVKARLHGSLAFTRVGHGTDRATILGLVGFDPKNDMQFDFGLNLPHQTNGMVFMATDN